MILKPWEEKDRLLRWSMYSTWAMFIYGVSSFFVTWPLTIFLALIIVFIVLNVIQQIRWERQHRAWKRRFLADSKAVLGGGTIDDLSPESQEEIKMRVARRFLAQKDME